MTTDVGHGRKRRGRRAGVKRRTPRAAIAAGALAAASIPLWPSSAGAEHTDPWLPHSPDEFKSETRTVIVAGVSCRIRVASGRNDEYVHASTNIESSQPECTNASWTLAMDYVSLGGESLKVGASGSGIQASLGAQRARDLTASYHVVTFAAGDEQQWFTLNHPK